jgi:hypothetical protein
MESGNKRKRGKKHRKNGQKGVRGDYQLPALVKDNEMFFNYCKAQKIISEEEWQAFEDILRVDLPASFRIQRSLP